MRIGTWNVEYAPRSRLERLRSVLDAHPADIWILTETHDDLSPGQNFLPVHSDPRPKLATRVRDGSRWVSIWSRYPLVERIDCGGRMDRVRTTAARFQVHGVRVVVYGTVLPWLGDLKHDWSEFDRIAPIQISEWREIRAAFPDDVVIVAGDWNQDMHTGSYYGAQKRIALLRSGLESCGLSCFSSMDRIPAGWLTNPPIDHIAGPAKLASKVVAAWPPNKRELADHGGIVVEVSADK